MAPRAADSADSSGDVARVRGVEFGWTAETETLRIERFDVARREKVFLKGPSGSGKSTLLGLICGVLTPRAGSIAVAGQDLSRLSSAKRDALRADRLGVIFQMFNLVPFLSVIENVTLPCRFSSNRRKRVERREGGAEAAARRLLDHLGLGEDTLTSRSVAELSVGQQQRVAAARALIGGPQLVIADEPTSALDADAREAFISLLIEESAANGSSLLFVSHDAALAQHFDREVDLTAINVARAGVSAT